MKTILLLALMAIPVFAEDWTITDGKTYKNVVVVKVEVDAVTILDSEGGALIPLSELPADLQKRFSYDPIAAEKAAKQRAADDAQSVSALKSEVAEYNEIKKNQQIEGAEQIEQGTRTINAERNFTLSQNDPSHGGVIPVAVDNSKAITEENLQIRQMQATSNAIQKDDEAHGYGHASGRIAQVVPEGFIGSVATRWGSYDPCFVQCDSKDMIDGQSWTGILIPHHTFQYTTALGAVATIPAFTTNLKETPSAPATSNIIIPRAPVSSMQEVGGG